MKSRMILLFLVVVSGAIGVWLWFSQRSVDEGNSSVNMLNTGRTDSNSNTNISVPLFLLTVQPSVGPKDGESTLVTLIGGGFKGGAKVSFGEKEASEVIVVDEKTITVNPPSGSGAVDVTVINPDGKIAKASAAYRYE